MSLEQTIADNTAAIRELIAAIAKTNSLTAAIEPSAGFEVQLAAKPVAAVVELPKAEPVVETPAPVEAKATSYDDVKKVVIQLTQAGKRDAIVAVLKSFGAEKAPDLKAEQYGDFLASLNQAIAA